MVRSEYYWTEVELFSLDAKRIMQVRDGKKDTVRVGIQGDYIELDN